MRPKCKYLSAAPRGNNNLSSKASLPRRQRRPQQRGDANASKRALLNVRRMEQFFLVVAVEKCKRGMAKNHKKVSFFGWCRNEDNINPYKKLLKIVHSLGPISVKSYSHMLFPLHSTKSYRIGYSCFSFSLIFLRISFLSLRDDAAM